LIFAVTNDVEEERCGSILFELDAIADAIRSVEQHADAQRQVGLLAEVANGLRFIVVEDLEVVLAEVWHQFIAAV
jgi:hypothetical protein